MNKDVSIFVWDLDARLQIDDISLGKKKKKKKERLTAIRVAGRYTSAIRLATLMVLESLRAFCVMQSMDLDSPDAAEAKLFREKTFWWMTSSLR